MQTQSQALISSLLNKNILGTPTFHNERTKREVLSVFAGVALLSALAQVQIPLPFTPVPITGQTFGVTLIALLWGRKLGAASILTYLTIGFLGAPVFATPTGALWGPTFGYLLGMFLSSFVIGGLADRGWSKTFPRALAAGFLGSVCVFSLGALVLSAFVPKGSVFAMGILPFLPGDLIKTSLAALIASRASKFNS